MRYYLVIPGRAQREYDCHATRCAITSSSPGARSANRGSSPLSCGLQLDARLRGHDDV